MCLQSVCSELNASHIGSLPCHNSCVVCYSGSPSEDTSQIQSVGLFDKVKEAFTPEPAVRQAESLKPPTPAQTAPEQADAAEATPNPVDEPFPLGTSFLTKLASIAMCSAAQQHTAQFHI